MIEWSLHIFLIPTVLNLFVQGHKNSRISAGYLPYYQIRKNYEEEAHDFNCAYPVVQNIQPNVDSGGDGPENSWNVVD